MTNPGEHIWQQLPDGFADKLAFEAEANAHISHSIITLVNQTLHHVPTHIIDVGSGTGADTVALALQFPTAHVHALDVSNELLDRVRSAAVAANCEQQVTTHRVDLNANWPEAIAHNADLVWAALAIHHLEHPALALRQAFKALKHGGVFVMIELVTEHETVNVVHAAEHSHAEPGASPQPSPHPRNAAHWNHLLQRAGFISFKYYEHQLETPRGVWIATKPDAAASPDTGA